MRQVILTALWVGAGGFVGSVLRYALSHGVQRHFPADSFPWGTLLVNLLGCFAIGLVFGRDEVHHVLGPQTRQFLLVGLLGGFTTFSTFGYETFVMLRGADALRAALNVLLHLGVGLIAVWLGLLTGRNV